MMEIKEIINTIMPFLIMSFVFATMRVILHIIMNIMKGNYEHITKEIKTEESTESKIDIDKDLRNILIIRSKTCLE